MIPKNIFQTWYTTNLPKEVQKIVDNMKEKNPTYHYYLYTDEEMDEFVDANYDGEIRDCYHKLNMIVAKADFWRYLVLYKYGGIYIDMDASIDIDLDTFICPEDEAIISTESGRDTVTQWALIFNKGHPILKRTIDIIVDNIKNNRYSDVWSMTGPLAFTQGINSFHNEFHGKPLHVKDIKYIEDFTYTHPCGIYRVSGNNYEPYFTFKHPFSHLLYVNKPHWTIEQQHTSIMKQ